MRQQIQTTSETADATMGSYYCLYRRSTHKKVGRSFKQPWTDRRYQSMDRQQIPVHGQTGGTSPWTDRRYQSMDRQQIPVHGQTEGTSPWTDRR